jgi:hypothetical protein
MKKISIAVLALVFVNGVFSQETETKNFRFGLKVAPSVNWMKPDNAKLFENGGNSVGFNWGLVTEFALSDLFSVSTGLELSYESGKINFIEPTYYSITPSYEFLETKKDETTGDYNPDGFKPLEDAAVELKKRKYASTYVTLPVAIKMKTKEIGYMTYFGEFGLNLAFRTKTKVNDEGTISTLNSSTQFDLNEMNYDKDMLPIRAQLQVGFGTEYKIAGSTAVFGALHYNLGFTNSVKKDSKYLLDKNSQVVNQKFSANGIRLTVGVLF